VSEDKEDLKKKRQALLKGMWGSTAH